MTTPSRVEMTPPLALREAIRAADALRAAAHHSANEGRSRAASEMTAALHRIEAAITAELRRRPETVREIGSAALGYFNPWPEARSLPSQQVGRIPIDDLKFLFDLEAVPLPRTRENIERVAGIAARLEGARHE